MTFKQAKKKLKKIANGKYHSITYELTEHHTGDMAAKCTLYIDGYGVFHNGKTWELAFSSLETTEPDLKEAP